MKKIVYLHGLKSAQGGEKVRFLTEENFVYAPKMNYNDPTTFKKVLDKITIFSPDLIIGSSMGGYFAYMFSSYLDIPVLLFNPALHKILMDDGLIVGNKEVKGYCVLGEDDDIVNPIQSNKLLKKSNNIIVDIVPGMAHRTPFEIFKSKVNKIISR